MEVLGPIFALVVVLGLYVGSLKLYGWRHPDAAAGEAGSFTLLVLLVFLVVCMIAIGSHSTTTVKTDQHQQSSASR